LALLLVNRVLTAYIWSPSAGWHRVPREFWLIAGMTIQDIVDHGAFDEQYGEGDRFLDAPEDIDGQFFVVWSEDVASLPEIHTDQSRSEEQRQHSTIATEGARPEPEANGVSQQRVEAWFNEVRCPSFEGQKPPSWRDCWNAAKAHFSPDRVVREVLQAARR